MPRREYTLLKALHYIVISFVMNLEAINLKIHPNIAFIEVNCFFFKLCHLVSWHTVMIFCYRHCTISLDDGERDCYAPHYIMTWWRKRITGYFSTKHLICLAVTFNGRKPQTVWVIYHRRSTECIYIYTGTYFCAIETFNIKYTHRNHNLMLPEERGNIWLF